MLIPYRKVLIVEDAQEWQQVYKDIVEESGYAYRLASTLEEAFALIDQEFFHLALVDLRLDVSRSDLTQGFEVLERIRRLNEGTATVVITGQIDFEQTKKTISGYKAVDIFVKDEFDKFAEEFPELMRKWILQALDDSRKLRFLAAESFAKQILPEVLISGVPSGEISALKQGLHDFFEGIYPVRRAKSGTRNTVDKDGKPRVETIYWSRLLGYAIQVNSGSYEILEEEKSRLDLSPNNLPPQLISALKAKTPKYPPQLGVLVYSIGIPFEHLRLE